MRIVFIQIVVEYGGAARCMVEFARRLSEHVDVSIVDAYGGCEPFSKAAREAGLDYHVLIPGGQLEAIGRHPMKRLMRISGTVPKILKLQARAEKLLGELQPTVICSNDLRSAFSVGISRKLRHIPLIVHMHGWYTPDMLPFYTRRLARKRCAALLAISHQTKTALVCSGIDPRKIHVLHNPIDVDQYQALADRPLDSPLPQSERAVRLLLPANLIRTKGQHTAILAMRSILDAGHDAVLWLAGNVAKEDEAYATETHILAKRLGVADRVEWLGLRGDIPQVIKAASMVILPSYSEGHPRVSLEAMALGKPFVATPVGGVLDMVLPGITGMLFEVEDDAGLADCIDELVRNPQVAKQIGQQAQEYVRRNFRPQQQTEKALALFGKLVSSTT
ncbi:MAG: glycosyltransferase family 4 protein [Phycisphaerae bacterium]|nr:glycosyltransferase family 4 protein [Phycisphaerae bacterium]